MLKHKEQFLLSILHKTPPVLPSKHCLHPKLWHLPAFTAQDSPNLQLGIEPAHLWAAGSRHINTLWVQGGEQTRRSEPWDGEIPWDCSTSLSVTAQPPQLLPADSLCLKLFSDLRFFGVAYFWEFLFVFPSHPNPASFIITNMRAVTWFSWLGVMLRLFHCCFHKLYPRG